ncbi:hypothetical protein WJX72_006116 [[Myrmecia] bisecta]|uniref:alpha-amylase n=1 Tax=[Myrmecia] bisecta TaxID=41462 RepID=A0AAW1PDB0_9CHLO
MARCGFAQGCLVVECVLICATCAPGRNGSVSQDHTRSTLQPATVNPSPGVFVHLFEWSWADVAAECEQYLGPNGFEGVQVSPAQEHIQGPAWWTRYQPVTYNLTSRSGGPSAFADMVKRCKAVGVAVYTDVVINHMAALPSGGTSKGTAGSVYGSRTFPIYSPPDFHHKPGDTSSNCVLGTDFSNRDVVQRCDLSGLPDLDTGAVQPEEYVGNGCVTEFNYPQELLNHFGSEGQLQYLETLGPAWNMRPSQQAVVFVDNHDLQRKQGSSLTYKDGALYRLAMIFMLAYGYGSPKADGSVKATVPALDAMALVALNVV